MTKYTVRLLMHRWDCYQWWSYASSFQKCEIAAVALLPKGYRIYSNGVTLLDALSALPSDAIILWQEASP